MQLSNGFDRGGEHPFRIGQNKTALRLFVCQHQNRFVLCLLRFSIARHSFIQSLTASIRFGSIGHCFVFVRVLECTFITLSQTDTHTFASCFSVYGFDGISFAFQCLHLFIVFVSTSTKRLGTLVWNYENRSSATSKPSDQSNDGEEENVRKE